jgi:hypothetical protein
MQRPQSLDPNDTTGTEDIDPNSIRMPRIGVAQGLSHEMTPGDTAYIDGLKLFDMFNTTSQEVYGKGPLTFVPITHEWRAIEFTPRSQGGGVVDLDVPKGDPRLKWTWSTPELKASKARADVPPCATEFEEFVVILLRKGKAPEPIMLSIPLKNKWNRNAANKLISAIALRRAAIYANVFSVDTSLPGKNDKGTFGVFTVKDHGFLPKDQPIGAAIYAHAEGLHHQLAGKTIVVQRASDDVDDSMAANPETTGSTEM